MAFQRIAALALLCAACSESTPGRKLASGLARGLIAREGEVAFLLAARRPEDPGVPEDLLTGDLWLDDRKVGSGVSSGEGAYAFSPASGELAFLASWRFSQGEGDLWVAVRDQAARLVAKEARTFAWSSRGELGWVARDAAGVGERSLKLPGAQAIAWSADGKRLAVRASAAAGGKLWVVDGPSAAPREIAAATSDFAFAPDGTLAALGPPPAKGGDRPLLLDGHRVAEATAFSFSPEGKEIALLSTAQRPGEANGDLYRMPKGGAPVQVASRVSGWRWSAGGDLLCLAHFDLRSRAGTLTVSTPGAPPKEIARRVQGFSLFGRRVLYLVLAPTKGDFRVELWGFDLAAPQASPHRIDEGVYGWDLSPDGSALYYKARCSGGPRSCALLRAPFSGGAPQLLAADVAGFDLSRDGARILVQQPHRGAPRAVDLAVISATGPPPGTVKPFVLEADPASRFADAGGRKVAYAVIAAGKGGVFLADVP